VIVLDTNVVSELMRPAPVLAVLDWVDSREPSELVITAITAAELRAGVGVLPAGRRRSEIGRRMESLLTQTFAGSVLPFDVDATPHYADVVATPPACGEAGNRDGRRDRGDLPPARGHPGHEEHPGLRRHRRRADQSVGAGLASRLWFGRST